MNNRISPEPPMASNRVVDVLSHIARFAARLTRMLLREVLNYTVLLPSAIATVVVLTPVVFALSLWEGTKR